jgi:hypothetical protein
MKPINSMPLHYSREGAQVSQPDLGHNNQVSNAMLSTFSYIGLMNYFVELYETSIEIISN